MEVKVVPWWRKVLTFALNGIRSGFGLLAGTQRQTDKTETQIVHDDELKHEEIQEAANLIDHSPEEQMLAPEKQVLPTEEQVQNSQEQVIAPVVPRTELGESAMLETPVMVKTPEADIVCALKAYITVETAIPLKPEREITLVEEIAEQEAAITGPAIVKSAFAAVNGARTVAGPERLETAVAVLDEPAALEEATTAKAEPEGAVDPAIDFGSYLEFDDGKVLDSLEAFE